MISSGIKISELVDVLIRIKAKHGDVEVFAGGTDYPDGVIDACYIAKGKGNAYVPENSVKILS